MIPDLRILYRGPDDNERVTRIYRHFTFAVHIVWIALRTKMNFPTISTLKFLEKLPLEIFSVDSHFALTLIPSGYPHVAHV